MTRIKTQLPWFHKAEVFLFKGLFVVLFLQDCVKPEGSRWFSKRTGGLNLLDDPQILSSPPSRSFAPLYSEANFAKHSRGTMVNHDQLQKQSETH